MRKEELTLVGDPLPKALDIDTNSWDPRLGRENERLVPTEDLKEVWISPSAHRVTKIGTSIAKEEECEIVDQLTRNVYLFA